MGLFGGKDWNVVAVTFERNDLYSINGNRAKGKDAEKVRDGAKHHARTIFWAVFNQKGAVLDSGPGTAQFKIPPKSLERLEKELQRIESIRDVLRQLETGAANRVAKNLIWSGYPLPKPNEDDD